MDYAISISDETSETIKAKKVFKIYNGIPYIEPKKIEMPNTFNIVAVGGLRKVKGYDNLISAMVNLPFDFHLTIIGEGTERKTLEKLIVQCSLEEKVSLVGFKKNVQDYLYSSDLQIISSKSEGFSLAMVEGLFYTRIINSTKVSGCTEILSDNLLYDLKDLRTKIMDIFENYDKYTNSFRTIKERYTNKLTIDNCTKEHERVYEEIIKRSHD